MTLGLRKERERFDREDGRGDLYGGRNEGDLKVTQGSLFRERERERERERDESCNEWMKYGVLPSARPCTTTRRMWTTRSGLFVLIHHNTIFYFSFLI